MKLTCKTFLIGVFVCFLLSSVSLFAQIRVDTDRSLQADVHVQVPKLGKVDFSVGGNDYTGLYMQHASLLVSKGDPALPTMTGLVMISEDGRPRLEILESKYTEVALERSIIPSRGAINRNVNPLKVPFTKGPSYEKDRWFPATSQIARISDPFIFREVRGVRLQVFPVQYNPVRNKLRVYSYIRARIKYEGTGGANVFRGRKELSRAYAPIYRKAFLNFATMPSRLAPLDESGRLIIISADEFLPAVKPLVEWKRKCGITTVLVPVSELGGATPENIKGFLQQQYDETGFANVLLVGDAEQIPTNMGENEGADSDPVYVKLAGDDHVPDAIISRISASTVDRVSYQVAKIINYEQYPDTGDDAQWYCKTLGIASEEGSPTDFERMDELKKALLDAGRFEDFATVYAKPSSHGSGGGYNGYPYPGSYPGSFPGPIPGVPHPHFPMEPPMPMYSRVQNTDSRSGSLKEQVFASVNGGVSLINYIGHGSSSAWVTSGFNVQDCGKLENGLKLPVIISVACVNGDFVGKNCFCEAWMNSGTIEKPRGAVAIFGSTTNQSWVPPCEVQAAIVSDFIINDTYQTVGGLMTNGIIKGLEIYGVEKHSEGVKMMEQWHIFGDGTTMVRTRKPITPRLKIKTESIDGESQVFVSVLDENGKPVENARVTCYTRGLEMMATALSNDQGQARVNIGLEKGDMAFLTIIGANLVPVVDKEIKF